MSFINRLLFSPLLGMWWILKRFQVEEGIDYIIIITIIIKFAQLEIISLKYCTPRIIERQPRTLHFYRLSVWNFITAKNITNHQTIIPCRHDLITFYYKQIQFENRITKIFIIHVSAEVLICYMCILHTCTLYQVLYSPFWFTYINIWQSIRPIPF